MSTPPEDEANNQSEEPDASPGDKHAEQWVEFVSESFGEERRDVSVHLARDGGLDFATYDHGPLAERLTGGGEFEYHYVVPTAMLPRFIEAADLDAANVLGSLLSKWSTRFDELRGILENELGIHKYFI